jgi:hypothetical protein
MNIAPAPSLCRPLAALLLAMIGATTPPSAAAQPPVPQLTAPLPAPVPAASRPPSAPLFAGLLQDVVGNRARLIQVSFVIIIIGIFILWKK